MCKFSFQPDGLVRYPNKRKYIFQSLFSTFFLLQSKPVLCDKATEETNPVAQKLITNTESDLQLSYAKQRRTKSSILLHKELDSRSKKAVRDYLYRVNEATAVLYARHVLASLLAEWPDDVAINEEVLDLSGPAHMTYILDMLMQLEEKQLWEKVSGFHFCMQTSPTFHSLTNKNMCSSLF